MTRLLIGFMLSVMLLSMGGHPHVFHPSATFTPGKYYENLTADAFGDEESETVHFAPAGTPDAKEAPEEWKAVEIGEEDFASAFRKQQHPAKILITRFFTELPREALVSAPSLPVLPQLSGAAPGKYIVQRVIRI